MSPPKLVVTGLGLGAEIEDRVIRCDAATIVPGGSNMLLRLFPSFRGIWEELDGAGNFDLVGDLRSESAMLLLFTRLVRVA